LDCGGIHHGSRECDVIGLWLVLKEFRRKQLRASSALDEQSAVQNVSCDSFSIVLTTNLSPAVRSFVVDPGYSMDHYQGLRRVANRPPSFLFAALLVDHGGGSFSPMRSSHNDQTGGSARAELQSGTVRSACCTVNFSEV